MWIVAKRLNGAVDLRARQIHVGHEASPRRKTRDDAPLPQMRFEPFNLRGRHLEIHHIGLRRRHLQARCAQSFRQVFRIRMIFGHSLHVMFQSVQPRGREHTGLAHAASQRFAPAAGGGDQRSVAQ